MKTFVLTVQCDHPQHLIQALQHALESVEEDPNRYNDMEVDEEDEQLCDPAWIVSTLSRTE